MLSVHIDANMKIRLGKSDDDHVVFLDVEKLFQGRLLIQGISGSWKSETANTILRKLKLEYKTDAKYGLQQIIFDWEGEREKFRNFGGYLMVGKNQGLKDGLHAEEAFEYGKAFRKLGSSVIVDLSSYETLDEREEITDQFIKGILLDNEKKYWKPCVVMIDEAHNLCRQSGECKSRNSVIRLCETGRKRNIATILVTQRLAQISKHATAQMANRIIGKTIEIADRISASKMMDISQKDHSLFAKLNAGEFYIFGDALGAINRTKLTVDALTKDEIEGRIIVKQIKKPELDPEKIGHQSVGMKKTPTVIEYEDMVDPVPEPFRHKVECTCLDCLDTLVDEIKNGSIEISELLAGKFGIHNEEKMSFLKRDEVLGVIQEIKSLENRDESHIDDFFDSFTSLKDMIGEIEYKRDIERKQKKYGL